MRFLLIIGLLFPIFLFAQGEKRDVLNPNQLRVKELILTIEDSASAGLRFPFSKIRIIDSRFDTSKIGYVYSDEFVISKKRQFERLVLRNGNGNSIEKYYADYYSSAFTQNDFELLIVMKRFWLSMNINSNDKRVEAANSVGSTEKLYCKWEYYLGKNEKYLPIKRIDTVLVNMEDLSRYGRVKLDQKRRSFVEYALNKLVAMLDYSNAVKQFDLQAKKTLEEIYAFNNRMNKIPILQDTVAHRGVYLSFDDFRNNRPSIPDFTEKKTRYRITNTENYLENGKGETISNYWGYSNGVVMRYGMLGNEKMYRVQNTFCFFIKVEGYAINPNNQAAYGGTSNTEPISKTKYELWVPYQIDMETGVIY